MSFMLNHKTQKQRYRTFFSDTRNVDRKMIGTFYAKNYDFISGKNKKRRIVTVINYVTDGFHGFKITSYVNMPTVKDNIIVQGNILKYPMFLSKVSKWKRIM